MAIFLVEDEDSLAELLKMNLELEGFDVFRFERAEPVLAEMDSTTPDLIVLDVNLPGMNGFKFMKDIQDRNYPVIFLTVKDDLKDRILGFKLGADDYITKPFEVEEFIFRVKAVLRRTDDGEDRSRLEAGPLVLDRDRRLLIVEGEERELTASQYLVMEKLMVNRRQVISRSRILQQLWNNELTVSTTRAVDMHINRLRKKMGEHRDCIKTVYGAGYKLDVN